MPIIVENLSYTYDPKAPFKKDALKNVSLTIEDGDFFGIIGHTGSGKSTLITHFNGLIPVQSGKIIVDGVDLTGKYDKKNHRCNSRRSVLLRRSAVTELFQHSFRRC